MTGEEVCAVLFADPRAEGLAAAPTARTGDEERAARGPDRPEAVWTLDAIAHTTEVSAEGFETALSADAGTQEWAARVPDRPEAARTLDATAHPEPGVR
ncbi:hypothetical protein AB5J56_43485 [Streptomyces sp. R21]|uniref:Uncharacterized protein n=1 Tax=Streptomyces sp. R21 TaxID=3238627 RepID=A0AB39PKP7_9ACTN